MINMYDACEQSSDVQTMTGLFSALTGLNSLLLIAFLMYHKKMGKELSYSTYFASLIPLTLALSSLGYALSAPGLVCNLVENLSSLSMAKFTDTLALFWVVGLMYCYSRAFEQSYAVRVYVSSVSFVTMVSLLAFAVTSVVFLRYVSLLTLKVLFYLNIISLALVILTTLSFMGVFIVHRRRVASGPSRSIASMGLACTVIFLIVEIFLVVSATVLVDFYTGYLVLFFRMFVMTTVGVVVFLTELSAPSNEPQAPTRDDDSA